MTYRKLQARKECFLCDEVRPLRKSHIIPNFFRRWLAREMGKEPRFFNPHTRIHRLNDDLTKHSMFCADCEALMCADESVARREILGKWRERQAPVKYGPWLLRFATGIAMKAAAVQLFTEPTTKSSSEATLPFNSTTEERLSEASQAKLELAFQAWRGFLRRQIPHPGRYELHLVAVDIKLFPGLFGLFGHNHIHTDDFAALLISLNGIAFVAVVDGHVDGLRRDTRLAVSEGYIGQPNHRLPGPVETALQHLSAANLATQVLAAQNS
jgi:hypothetical protein